MKRGKKRKEIKAKLDGLYCPIDIFKNIFEPCDNIKNDEIETSFDDDDDEMFIKELKASVERFLNKYYSR